MKDTQIILGLTSRYCEPQRHYHTIGHIADMLWRGRTLELSTEQVLAIWYHDAIYDPTSSTNEIDSAALAVAELRCAGFTTSSIEAVEQMVLDTLHHKPTLEASREVIDLDLASLALPREAYRTNTKAIRREYAHVSDTDFDAGRLAFLERFLERENIFWTDWGHELEAAARCNLELDRDELSRS